MRAVRVAFLSLGFTSRILSSQSMFSEQNIPSRKASKSLCLPFSAAPYYCLVSTRMYRHPNAGSVLLPLLTHGRIIVRGELRGCPNVCCCCSRAAAAAVCVQQIVRRCGTYP
ncbi:hypothetical protein BX666DRAFT_1217349 [Dichotomocladium elegans]|nr:hypothetical protein BX666DRAFT_1217349 [Dichotomocladium elegans]